jgi:hypothetical protein
MATTTVRLDTGELARRMEAQGYAPGAPTQEVLREDGAIARRAPCRCGATGRAYEPFTRCVGLDGDGRPVLRYRAYACCAECGRVEEM